MRVQMLTITEDIHGLLSFAEGAQLPKFGQQYDDNAQTLAFVRPAGRESDTLKLYFEDAKQSHPAQVLGLDNAYTIPEYLTQTNSLRLAVAFVHNGIETQGSSAISMEYLKSLPRTTGGTGEVTRQYVDAQDAATLQAAKTYADTVTAVSPDDGNALQRRENGLFVAQGGSGGGVSQAYVDSQDAATLAGAQQYAGSKANAALASAKTYADEKAAVSAKAGNIITRQADGLYATAPAADFPQAAGSTLGGVYADPAQSGDTQPVRITAAGKLVTAPGSGGSAANGLPSGGLPGQVLAKQSGNDYDAVWADAAGVAATPRIGLQFIGDSITGSGLSVSAVQSDNAGNVQISTSNTDGYPAVNDYVGLFFVDPPEFNGYFLVTEVNAAGKYFVVKNPAAPANTTGSAIPAFGTMRRYGSKPGGLDYHYTAYGIAAGQRKMPVNYITGYGGSGTGAWLQHLDKVVFPFGTEYVHILLGTNDMYNGDASVPNTIRNYKAIIEALMAKGYKVIVGTVPPQRAADGYHAKVVQFNTWLKTFASASGITVVDYYKVMGDPATGAALAGLLDDRVHPSVQGHFVMGQELGRVMQTLFGESLYLPMSNAQNLAAGLNLFSDPTISNVTPLTGDVNGVQGAETQISTQYFTGTIEQTKRPDGFGNNLVFEGTTTQSGARIVAKTTMSGSFTADKNYILLPVFMFNETPAEGAVYGQQQLECKLTIDGSERTFVLSSANDINKRPHLLGQEYAISARPIYLPQGAVVSEGYMQAAHYGLDGQFSFSYGRPGMMLVPEDEYLL